jgi:GMP synthase-like glutamine amidotransferase
MLIGILQTGEAPEDLRAQSGDYPAMFETLLQGHGFTFRTWRVLDNQFPADVHDADGWLITGSRYGAYEDHPFIKPLEDFIRRAYDAHVPLVGICFGHQIIAQALGGRVEKYAGGWSVGPQAYDFGDDTVVMNAWHQDQVTVKPADAVRVGSSPFCANAALIYSDRAFTVQAHPEFRDDFISGLMATRGKGVVPDPQLAAAAARLGTPLDSGAIADEISAFFKQPRG